MPPEIFEGLRGETPSPVRVAATERSVIAALKPVRPMPRDGWLVSMCAIAFVLLAMGGAALFGTRGFQALRLSQMLVEYAAVFGAALLLSFCMVQQMIPGARRSVPPVAAVLASVLVLSIVTPLLFPDFGMNRFVKQGMPCLELGMLCAVVGGVATWLFVRRGFLTDPMSAALAAAGLSGVLGVAVLAIHCPVLSAAHILVWHVGVIVIAVLGGAGIGYARTG